MHLGNLLVLLFEVGPLDSLLCLDLGGRGSLFCRCGLLLLHDRLLGGDRLTFSRSLIAVTSGHGPVAVLLGLLLRLLEHVSSGTKLVLLVGESGLLGREGGGECSSLVEGA